MNRLSIQLLLAVTLAASAVGSQGAIISVDMTSGGAIDASLLAAPGDSFDLDIVLSNTLDLGGFQFELSFDSAVLAATLPVISGDIFGLDTFELSNSIVGNTISFAEVSLGLPIDAVLGSVLATIHFDVIAGGTSALSLSNTILSDSSGAPIAVAQVNGTLESQQASVGVPAPATVVLFGIALAALGLTRRTDPARQRWTPL